MRVVCTAFDLWRPHVLGADTSCGLSASLMRNSTKSAPASKATPWWWVLPALGLFHYLEWGSRAKAR